MAFNAVSRARMSLPVDVSKPYDASALRSKNILITGAANGLGALMVRHWASLGANIVIGDIDDDAGAAIIAELRAAYPDATFIYQHCDVTQWESQVELFDVAVRDLPGGGIDIVVPNAGILNIGASGAFENPQLVNGKLRKPHTRTFDVNITGVWYTTHLALYHLPLNPSPTASRCILLIGSLASIMAFAGVCQYTTSKHAVLGIFRTLRGTAGTSRGIRVNMICPYYVNGSNMLPAKIEATLLAGGAPGETKASDVVDTATRLIADSQIWGRALAIGPKVKEVPVDEEDPHDPAEGVIPDLAETEIQAGGRAVWEIYADDYRRVDTWVWRYLGILNTLTVARGAFRWFQDALTIWRRK